MFDVRSYFILQIDVACVFVHVDSLTRHLSKAKCAVAWVKTITYQSGLLHPYDECLPHVCKFVLF